jgi:transcriptional regulator with GAF, ATPase, and Fis domain
LAATALTAVPLGAFRLRARVGSGSAGTVFRAEDGEARPVAIKVGRPADASLRHEAAVLALAGRRWGPVLLGAGEIASAVSAFGVELPAGASWLAESWTEGATLARVLEQAAPTADDRERLAAVVAHGVGRGLEELHAVGLRHGDVKPANVLVAAHAAGRPGALDRAEDRGATLVDLDLAADVAAGALRGATPRYLAPDVRAGLEPPTPAADLFAFGLVLAEILAPELLREAVPEPARVAEALRRGGVVASWAAALVAPAAGARPSAGWIAGRAAAWLGLGADPAAAVADRRARVRRAYLAARALPLPLAAAAIAPAVDGAPRRWLEEALAAAAGGVAPVRSAIEPLDRFATARWLVALIGPLAASWPVPPEPEGALAERLLRLAELASPEAWTVEDVLGHGRAAERARRARPARSSDADRWVELARALAAPRPEPSALDEAEDEVGRGAAPAALAVELASALVRGGEIGRAFAVLSRPLVGAGDEATLLAAEIARRRGDRDAARALATKIAPSSACHDAARALAARLAWDAGDLSGAARALGGASGAAAAEVRALVAYARGEHEAGLSVLVEAAAAAAGAGADGGLGLARLEGTRGMLEHACGRSGASAAAFARAVDLAVRAGAVVEEATYLTGLAAAGVDEGAVTAALAAATRGALLWERLGRPALAARAHLSRAAAFALVGASHEADVAAELARAHARSSGDVRAAAYAGWAIVETRPPGDARARAEALACAAALTSPEDRVRAAARVLIWADGAGVDVAALDASADALPAGARWEWWGARATRADPADRPRVLAAIRRLLDLPAPVASKGPALAASVSLARALGDGDAARRIEAERRALAAVVRAGVPPSLRAGLASVAWASASGRDDGDAAPAGMGLPADQVGELEAIVRALSSRDRLKPLLAQVVDTMVLWTGVERGLLLLRAPDGGLVPRAARNLARQDLAGDQLALSTSLARRAMAERETICATDAFAQVGDLHASVHALGLRSVLAVPLVARGDVLGVVYLDDRVRRGAFGPGELAWVRLVASQAALAIADARDQTLLRRAVRRAERANARIKAELGAREAELATVRAELASNGSETRFRYDEIAGRSEPVRALLRLVDRVTMSDVPVLIDGESGTGKELVARAIHANGPRGHRPFVGENCGSVPETLLESTLFGHVRGAFTGASATRAGLFDVADGGTLFLDEIGEMPLSMQTKLLRVLQNGEVRPVGGERSRTVDVRVIGATHRDLEAMVVAGTFREDLFYRLNVVSIRVPPLRERREDIPLLVARFVEKYAATAGAEGTRRKIRVTRAAMDRLTAFPWPGNVRQLENEIRRALVLADERIDVGELSEEVGRGGPSAARDAGLGLKARVDALETQLVRDALQKTGGNQTRAAEVLGVSRFGLQKMMRRLGIKVADS